MPGSVPLSLGLLVWALMLPGAGLPAPGDGDATQASAPSLEDQILEHDRNLETRVVGLRRFRLSHPQELSGGVGAMIVRQPADYDCSMVCEYRGLLLQAEPGLAGASISAGYAVVTADKRRRKHFLADIHLGYGVKGMLLRTWERADLEPDDQTLLGVEGNFTVIGINFSLGLFRPVGVDDPQDDWVVSGGVGWGF